MSTKPGESHTRRAAHIANALLCVLVLAGVASQFDGQPWSAPDTGLILGAAALLPSALWFASLSVPGSASLAVLALAANVLSMIASMFILANFALLGAATGTAIGFTVLGSSLAWLLAGALNVRTAWADRPPRSRTPHDAP